MEINLILSQPFNPQKLDYLDLSRDQVVFISLQDSTSSDERKYSTVYKRKLNFQVNT